MRYFLIISYFIIYGILMWLLHFGAEQEWMHTALIVGTLFIGFVITMFMDWRNRKASEQFKDSQNFLSQVLEASPSAAIIINSDGIIQYVNPATELVLGSNKTAGRNILQFATVKGTPLEEAIQQGFKGKRTELIRYYHVSATTGRRKTLNVYMSPVVFNQQSARYGVLMMVHDVSYESDLLAQLEKNYLSTFNSFAKVVDARDGYTGSHSANVNELVDKMLKKMDLTQEKKQDIHIAAMLHDIGKVGIPDSVLNKEGTLTEEEYSTMKSHPEIGADLLSELEAFHKVHRIIRHHHERWDGRGYPSGLKKEQIPLGARMIAIADAYDAITSDRIYRKARTPCEALAILRHEKNRQFDGRLVDVFEQMLIEEAIISLEEES